MDIFDRKNFKYVLVVLVAMIPIIVALLLIPDQTSTIPTKDSTTAALSSSEVPSSNEEKPSAALTGIYDIRYPDTPLTAHINTVTDNPLLIGDVPEELKREIRYSAADDSVIMISEKFGFFVPKKTGMTEIIAVLGDTETRLTVQVDNPLQRISIDPPFVMETGEMHQFRVKYTPADTSEAISTTWSVSDESIGTIDRGGLFKALRPGKCTVTCNVNGHTNSCTVTVRVPLQGISFSTDIIKLIAGQYTKLSVNYYPSDATVSSTTKAKWTSSNPTVLSISKDGYAQALSIGISDVTCEIEGFVAACTVRVTMPITAVILSQSMAQMKVGDSLQLQAYLFPANHTEDNDIYWSSTAPEVAGVAAGVVTAAAPGTCTITASHGNFAATCKITVTENEPLDPDDPSVSPEDPDPPVNTGRIFIGDSRFYMMAINVTPEPNDIFITKGGEYYSWFKDSAVPQLREILNANPHYHVIINMGVNDCANYSAGFHNFYANNYVQTVNKLVSDFPETAFSYASVGYCDGVYHGVHEVQSFEINPLIDTFNATIRADCTANYIPLGEYISGNAIRTVDGVHYGAATSKMIYEFLCGF